MYHCHQNYTLYDFNHLKCNKTCVAWFCFFLEDISCALERMCILLPLYGKFHECMLSPCGLMCSLSPMFPYWFPDWMIHLLLKVGYWTSILLLYCCLFLPSSMLIFALHFYVGCINIYKCYMTLMNWSPSLHVMTFLSFVTVLGLNFVCFLADISRTAPALFLFSFTWNIFFHAFTFSWWVSLKLRWISYRICARGSVYGEGVSQLFLPILT